MPEALYLDNKEVLDTLTFRVDGVGQTNKTKGMILPV